MDSNAFLNDLMSKMKLPEAKGKKKAEQSESVAQILAAMQKVKTEKKKPPVTSYAPTKEMPVNELESMEEFSQLASDVMQECRPAIPAVKTSISEKTVRVAAYIRVSSTNPAQEDSYKMQERYFMSLLAGHPPAFIPIMAFPQQAGKDGQVSTVCSGTASRGKLTV